MLQSDFTERAAPVIFSRISRHRIASDPLTCQVRFSGNVVKMRS
jgi:hypothetical protein